MFEFLIFLASKFELIVFCNGESLTCTPVLDYIEADCAFFKRRLFQSHTLFIQEAYCVKYYDFLMQEGRNSDNTIIIESQVHNFCLNIYNGIPIRPYSDPDIAGDKELPYLANYLSVLEQVPSVNDEISKTIKRGL